MSAATFWAGIVLALALGALLAALWFRSRRAAEDARAAAQPLADSLSRIERQLQDIEAQRRHALGGLEHHLATLSRDTLALAQALRGTHSRGRWGELTLKRVAELAGMSAHCDFEEQASQGGRRPDMVVRLPGGRALAVDAKAPLSGYLEAEQAPDAAARAAALDKHAQQLWRHVTDLAAREYWAQFATAPEMVILFLPGDHFLSAALERRPDLLEAALAKRVLLATPVTLVSVLKGAAVGWREECLARNAEELRRIAQEFQERVRSFGDAYSDAGRNLQRAIDAYNKSVASWDARLLPSLRRMRELGAAGPEPPEPAHISTAARLPRPMDTGGTGPLA